MVGRVIPADVERSDNRGWNGHCRAHWHIEAYHTRHSLMIIVVSDVSADRQRVFAISSLQSETRKIYYNRLICTNMNKTYRGETEAERMITKCTHRTNQRKFLLMATSVLTSQLWTFQLACQATVNRAIKLPIDCI